MSTAGNSDIYIPLKSKRKGMSNFLLEKILLMCAVKKKIQELEKIKK
jgi:hypothetical protein